MDTGTAQQLRVVNAWIVAQAIIQKVPRVLVLTDADLTALAAADPAGPGNLQQAIAQNYRQVFLMTKFGQNDENVYVYLTR